MLFFVKLDEDFFNFESEQLFMESVDFTEVSFNELRVGVGVEQDGHNCLGSVFEVVHVANIENLELFNDCTQIFFLLIEVGQLLVQLVFIAREETLQLQFIQERVFIRANPRFL
jgi:hypothetical protein